MNRSLLVLSVLVAGCDWFDPSLYMNRDGGGDDAGDVDAGDTDAGSSPLSDRCVSGIPTVTSSNDFFVIDTRTLVNDVDDDAMRCVEHATPGSDGFIAIPMTAGEKWHVHFRVMPGTGAADPAVLVFSGCADLRDCSAGIDVCDSRDEHLSFIAPSTGTFFVGLDTRDEGGALAELLVVRPTCGNGGTAEHSEACDDGATADGDGCDAECRVELPMSADEDESNDDVTAANVLPGSATINGELSGRCDSEFFVIDVPAGASVGVTVTAAGGADCTAADPAVELSLLSRRAPTQEPLRLGDGRVRGTSTCPVIDPAMETFAAGLAAGEHYLKLRAPAADRPFSYRLSVTVTPP